MTKNDIRLDCSGWKYDDSDIQKCMSAFATSQANLRSLFESGFGDEFKYTEDEFRQAEKDAITLVFEDYPMDAFRDYGNEDCAAERSSNGRFLNLGTILLKAEGFMKGCAKSVMKANHPIVQVHFRKSKRDVKGGKDGEVVAVFTTKEMVDNCDADMLFDGYAHSDHFISVSAEWAREQSVATEEEYRDLCNELHDVEGYRIIMSP